MDFRFCSDQHAIWDPRCNSRKLVQEGHWTRAAMLAMARSKNVQHCHLFPWCNVQRRNTYLAFCVPCQACDEPCRPADRDTWRLRLQPPPKEEPRHGRYLCLDPFLTVCTNGSPALSSREASQYSSAFQGMSPYFRNVSPSQALGTFLLPRPSQPTARPQSDCNSEKAEALLLQSQTDTTEALSRRHTPLALFQSYPFLMVISKLAHFSDLGTFSRAVYIVYITNFVTVTSLIEDNRRRHV